MHPTPKSLPPLYAGVVHSDCAYGGRHLADAFGRRPWWRTYGSAAAYEAAAAAGTEALPLVALVDEYEEVAWERVLSPPHLTTSNYCVRKGLSRKANFARLMAKHAARCGGACPLSHAVPATEVIDTVPVFVSRPAMIDYASAMAEALADAEEGMAAGGEGAAWILKPSLANKGAEVYLVTTMDEVVAAITEWRDVGQWVLQRYLPNPMLLGGRKFHLRVYVLADGALRGWVFQEALVLFAVERYTADLTATHAHITNTCVNVGHADWREARYVRSTRDLPALLVDAGLAPSLDAGVTATAALWDAMNGVLHHAFAAMEGAHASYMPLPHAYELYGVDFLVDAAAGVHLLEFNPTPDIKQTGSRLDPLIADMVEGVVAIGIDSRFPPPPDVPAYTPSAPSRVWRKVYDKEWPSAKGAINISFK